MLLKQVSQRARPTVEHKHQDHIKLPLPGVGHQLVIGGTTLDFFSAYSIIVQPIRAQ